ncbi:serine/threonine-protein kinase [Kitasatospora sp. NPDC058965]|uniref:serine/threonine-protein kinase n=1 Tax=Kitasatospora sp. NPDC058965 TaxID=3346682 RepID=UPI0036C73949
MKPLEPGDPATVGPYQVLRRLGAGGMGQVYLGRSPGGRFVAIKRILTRIASQPEFRKRFQREVAAVQRVGEEWTAAVLDADTESAEPWVATAYITGLTLQEAVTQFGPLSEQGVRALAAGLAESLAWVHARGLVHRDIKPSNVMLSAEGPRLIDFGIARALDGSATAGLTRTGYAIGTLSYMSPEQHRADPVGPASDLFQLGAVMVFAATGRDPFRGQSEYVLTQNVVQGEPDLGELGGELRAIALSCLQKEAELRPAPERLAAVLAPQGSAVLLEQEWLGARLLQRLLREASELINLDSQAPVLGTQRLGPAREAPADARPGSPVPPGYAPTATYVPAAPPGHAPAPAVPARAPQPAFAAPYDRYERYDRPAEPESEGRLWFNLVGSVLLMSGFVGLLIFGFYQLG